MPMRPPVHRPAGAVDPVANRRAYEADRGSPTSRGYDGSWKRLRIQHLKAEPLCRFCRAMGRLVAAEVVDHIVDIQVRPELRLDPANLRSLCVPCHNRRTAQDTAAARRGGRRGG
jgi:5-methylcytosine-specific restriction protein A